MGILNLAIAQINPKVGDLKGNIKKILKAWERLDKEAHLICFPPFSLTGYPLEDLLFRKDFLEDCRATFFQLLNLSQQFTSSILLGYPLLEGGSLFYKEVLLYQGKSFELSLRKFNNRLYLEEKESVFFQINKVNFSLLFNSDFESLNKFFLDPSIPGVILFLEASPYVYQKFSFKEKELLSKAKAFKKYVVYVNLVGGQDDLVFDGRSLVLSPEGELLIRSKAFEEDFKVITLKLEDSSLSYFLNISIEKEVPLIKGQIEKNLEEEEEIYSALVLALRDYSEKNSFKGALLGLSGGIDSALTAVLAVDALGKDGVKALFMPTQFTSSESYEDAKELAKNLNIPLIEFPIQKIFAIYREEIQRILSYQDFTVAEENLQARIRANLLFYLSNRENLLVLSTSNKSEAATGYGTIYGDIAGGFAPLKDIYKTQVYKLAHYRNSINPIIPERIFAKPPSAELRPNQRDEDTLPPYEILDEILKFHLEKGLSSKEIVEKGFPEEMVKKVFWMLKISEYKRRQAPLGPKITFCALGREYRLPITSGYF